MKGDSLLLGRINRSPSSPSSNNENFIDLLSNVGGDNASHKVVLMDSMQEWNDDCGILPDTCLIDNQEQRFLAGQ